MVSVRQGPIGAAQRRLVAAVFPLLDHAEQEKVIRLCFGNRFGPLNADRAAGDRSVHRVTDGWLGFEMSDDKRRRIRAERRQHARNRVRDASAELDAARIEDRRGQHLVELLQRFRGLLGRLPAYDGSTTADG